MSQDFRISGIDAIKETMDKYQSSSNDFFGLKDDGDLAKVRFAHGDDKDLDIYVVHKVSLNGKDKLVACLSPVGQACPLCQSGYRANVRIVLSVLDTRDNKMKIWDRGKTEIPTILGLVTRYGRLDGRYYEIVRHGKKGDKETKYQFFPLDPIPNADELKREPILSETGYIMKCTESEMRELLNQVAPVTNSFGAQTQQGQGQGKMF